MSRSFEPDEHYAEEKARKLLEVRVFYENALRYYDAGNLAATEQELVKVLKPFLSKSLMLNIYVKVEDFKDKLLDSMYLLGNIYLESAQYPDHHSKAAAIFQYCAAFAKKYHTTPYKHKIGDTEINIDFLQEAHSIEEKFLSSIGKFITPTTHDSITQKIAEYAQYQQGCRC